MLVYNIVNQTQGMHIKNQVVDPAKKLSQISLH